MLGTSEAAATDNGSVTKACHPARMNSMSPVLIADLQRSPLADAACTWRGRYVEEFAIAEVIVSEALATLSTFDGSGARSLLPRAVGQRFEALRAVVDAGGPLALVGCRVVKALDDLREHQRRRNFLCHGSSEITADDLGDWRMIPSLTNFRAGAIERSSMQITAAEAALLLEGLRSARLRLDGQLRGMLASLTRWPGGAQCQSLIHRSELSTSR